MGQTGLCKFCGFLRFVRKSAVSSGFLRISAPPKCCTSQEKRRPATISENRRKFRSGFASFSNSTWILWNFFIIVKFCTFTEIHIPRLRFRFLLLVLAALFFFSGLLASAVFLFSGGRDNGFEGSCPWQQVY